MSADFDTYLKGNIFIMQDTLSDLASSQQHLERTPCANFTQLDGLKVNCDNEASLVCSQCFLVKVWQNPNRTNTATDRQAHFDLSTVSGNVKRRTGLYTRSNANQN